MYSKPLIMETLTAKHTTFSVDFHFTNNITLLMGDSGVGKTLIFGILQELSVTDKRLICLNYMDIAERVAEELANASGKLFIIDNADTILTDDMRKEIAFDTQNQYLIIGRNPKNLLTTEDNLFELRQEKNGNVISYSLEKYL